MHRLVMISFLLLASTTLFAQQDAEGSKDHPMLSRMPGYFIVDYDDQEFGAHEFEAGGEKVQRVEGHYWKIEYGVKEGAKKAGPLQIARNYSSAMAQKGGVKLYEVVDAGGGVATVRFPTQGKNIWVEVRPYNSGDGYTLTVVEEAALKQEVEFSAKELAALLNEKGAVALRNILFDTGKATLKAESEKPLASVGELLKNDPMLKLEIQGHTDNVGTKESNLKLSKERTEAVKAYMVKNFAISADRLTTAGFGDTKPVADNKTEEGRGQNRRVELLKK